MKKVASFVPATRDLLDDAEVRSVPALVAACASTASDPPLTSRRALERGSCEQTCYVERSC